MNKIVKIVFILAVLLSANGMLFSQTVTWQKWYDYNNFEESAEDVIQTFDGGYIILSNIFTSIQRTVITKMDQFGNAEWQKLYDMNNVEDYLCIHDPLPYPLTVGM